MNILCKPSTAEDASFLQELFFSVRAPEFQMAGLDGPVLTQLLEMQYRAQSLSYASNYPAARNDVIWVDGERVGRTLVDVAANRYHLVDIALLPAYRGRGVGTRVLQQLIAMALADKAPVSLSVRPDNPARRLYERMGFRATSQDVTQVLMEYSPGYAPSEDPPTSSPVETAPVVQGYSYAYFRSLIGKTVQARLIRNDSDLVPPPVDAVIVDVQLIPAPMAGAFAGDSFHMELTVKHPAPFVSECIELTPDGAQPMAVFVSALGPKDGAMAFQAIFNRAERPQAASI